MLAIFADILGAFLLWIGLKHLTKCDEKGAFSSFGIDHRFCSSIY